MSHPLHLSREDTAYLSRVLSTPITDLAVGLAEMNPDTTPIHVLQPILDLMGAVSRVTAALQEEARHHGIDV